MNCQIYFQIFRWWYRLCVVRNNSASCSTVQSWAFLTPEWTVQVLTWSSRASIVNFLQSQVESGSWVRPGILAPTQVVKKVYHRLRGHAWGHPLPETRLVISVRRTESSSVTIMNCCVRRRSCSPRRETANVSLRSRKGCQGLRICMVTGCWKGMLVMLEASTPRTW